MKTMLLSDLLAMKSSLVQMSLISVVVVVFMALAAKSLTVVCPAITVMLPFMFLFSTAAIDEQNGWEHFRLSLPISRRQVVFGRYGSLLVVAVGAAALAITLSIMLGVLAGLLSGEYEIGLMAGISLNNNPPIVIASTAVLGCLVVFVGCSVALPLIVRFGITKATRFIPVVVVLLMATVISIFGDCIGSLGFLTPLELQISQGIYLNAALLATALVLAALAIYIASALLAAKLYEKREL